MLENEKKTTFVLKLVNTNININLFYDNCWWFNKVNDSGLSITEWELFKGILPPFNEKPGMIILIYIKKFHNLS